MATEEVIVCTVSLPVGRQCLWGCIMLVMWHEQWCEVATKVSTNITAKCDVRLKACIMVQSGHQGFNHTLVV